MLAKHWLEHCLNSIRVIDHTAEITVDTDPVHFMRFQFPEALRSQFASAEVAIEVDHPEYRHRVVLGPEEHQALARDLED